MNSERGLYALRHDRERLADRHGSGDEGHARPLDVLAHGGVDAVSVCDVVEHVLGSDELYATVLTDQKVVNTIHEEWHGPQTDAQ